MSLTEEGATTWLCLLLPRRVDEDDVSGFDAPVEDGTVLPAAVGRGDVAASGFPEAILTPDEMSVATTSEPSSRLSICVATRTRGVPGEKRSSSGNHLSCAWMRDSGVATEKHSRNTSQLTYDSALRWMYSSYKRI